MANHVVRLKLHTRKYDDYLNSKFFTAWKLYNEMVSWINEQEEARVSSETYKVLAKLTALRSELEKVVALDTSIRNKKKKGTGELSEEEQKSLLSTARKSEINKVIKALNTRLKAEWVALNNEYGLNFGKFVNPSKKYGRVSDYYQKLIQSNSLPSEVGTEAIANAVSGYVKRKKNGAGSENRLNFKKFKDFSSIEFRKTGFKLTPTGLYLVGAKKRNYTVYLPFKFQSTDEQRLHYAMEREKLALVNISRSLEANGKYSYYANLVFSGTPYNYRTVGKEGVQVGLDFGVEKVVAYSSTGELKMFSLSVGKEYANELASMQQALELKRRTLNPHKYNEDGTIKKGNKEKWVTSKAYNSLLAKFNRLNRKIVEVRKHHMLSIVREIMSMGDSFYVEALDYSKMQAKKELELRKDGTGYKSRANYGSQLLYASPSMLKTLLEQKLGYQGIELNKVSTYDSKLGQINHLTGTYTKYDLSEKYRDIDGVQVNRRLYTAYLLSHFTGNLSFSDIPRSTLNNLYLANQVIKDF